MFLKKKTKLGFLKLPEKIFFSTRAKSFKKNGIIKTVFYFLIYLKPILN